jgi:hypothetical protein
VRVLFDEESYRAVARSIVGADEGEPRWTPLLLGFRAHASCREPLRAAVPKQRDRFFTGCWRRIVRVVPAAAAPPETLARVRAEVVAVEAIERQPGPAAELKLVKRV